MRENEQNKRTQVQKCCICGKTFQGWGNDAAPIKNGVCCDKCNDERVIPARLKVLYGFKF